GLSLRQRRRLAGIAGVPVPDQLPAVDVEGADYARLRLDGIVVVDGAPDDDLAGHDDGGRGRVIITGRIKGHARFQPERSLIGKRRANLPARRVERNQPRIRRRKVDALRTGGTGLGRWIDVVGNSPAGLVLPVGIETCIAVEFPLLLAGRGVERNCPVVRRAEIEAVSNLEGRNLVSRLPDILRQLHVTSLVAPDLLQLADILEIDLVERGVTLAKVGAPILMPLAGRN